MNAAVNVMNAAMKAVNAAPNAMNVAMHATIHAEMVVLNILPHATALCVTTRSNAPEAHPRNGC
jgi:hypothetical protein